MKFLASTLALACAFAVHVSADTIFGGATDATWHYLAAKDAFPDGWAKPGFDDAKWAAGAAPLGYGETRLKTTLPASGDAKVNTVVFRKSFTAPKLAEADILTLSLCIDDGAVVYLNGTELGRLNMKPGPTTGADFAVKDVPNRGEGYYNRVRIPVKLLKTDGPNVVAVEVHNASAASDDFFFDAALRTMPAREENPKISPEVSTVIDAYYKGQRVPPGMTIADGYLDGGRNMKFDADGRSKSGREILVVDRKKDTELQKMLAFARQPELQKLAPQERAVRLAKYVDQATTPPGGPRLLGVETERFAEEFANQPVYIGEFVEQCSAGVCRHRSLLYKLLADEAGLKVSLVRGLIITPSTPQGGAHAWNELTLDNGHRLMVDVTYRVGKWDFPDLTETTITGDYRHLDGTPWYEGAGAVPETAPAAPTTPAKTVPFVKLPATPGAVK
jgi:hypothetical protein